MRPRPLSVVLPLLLAAGMAQALAADEPFRDPNLPLEGRVDDLVSRLTLDEKTGMLGQVQPAIPRLGIKAFTNRTEGLHGLGWEPGRLSIMLGASSADVRLEKTIEVREK